MHVLIVRLSSMGDLVQTLPALTDAAKAIPGVRFDWVVDESFAQVPAWHPRVERVMPSAFRRWRRDPRRAAQSGEPREFLRQLRSRRYDLIVDVQCELKSALAARLAKGPRYGYDRRAVHEWGAQFFYQQKFFVPKGQHSIRRMRELLARALGYAYDENEVDYGVGRASLGPPPLVPPGPYLVFIHSTSWTSKCWAEVYWQELTRMATRAGFHVVLPWGSEAERQRSLRIAAGDDRVIVLPQLSISEKAAIIARAHATIGLDTGLSHIAAAFDVPSVSIYGATDPLMVAALGRHQRHLASDFACVKCHEVQCTYDGAARVEPACLVGIRPAQVWLELQQVMNGAMAGATVTSS
jgi:heptosyltransferase-1